MMELPVADGGWAFDHNLGAGGFGIVQLWVHKQSGKKLAIKKCRWSKTHLKEHQELRWTDEVDIMKHLKHPNIVKTMDIPFKIINEDSHLPVLCMEYCIRGDLRKILDEPDNCCGINEFEAINAMKNISSAVEYLHVRHITHRDLKPENVVIQEDRGRMVYKLIDLGYAKELGEDSTSASLVGTLNYVAPELLWKEKYSCSVDYWSLGILFYELITGIQPFLPGMPHTIAWMQYIQNKTYEDICAFQSNGQIIFEKNIQEPTQVSRCLRNKLVDWFRIVLQWDPKKRGKSFDERGKSQVVVFKMLQSILPTNVVHVFCASSYKVEEYEVTDTTTVMELQSLIEKDSKVGMQQQILTNYFGKIINSDRTPLLSLTNDPVLYVFQIGSPLEPHIPALAIPPQVQKMMGQARNHLQYDILLQYYRTALFFLKQETHMFELYIFAITIKVDLVISKLHLFRQNIIDVIAVINDLVTNLNSNRPMCSNVLDGGGEQALETDFIPTKVTNLVRAATQIKTKIEHLIESSSDLRGAADFVYLLQDFTQLCGAAVEVYKTFKKGNSHKPAQPTAMVKIMCEFLKVRDTQVGNEEIKRILRKTFNVETELLTLQKILDSVTALIAEYQKEVQHVTSHSSTHGNRLVQSGSELSGMTDTFESDDWGTQHTNNSPSDLPIDVENDLIYDNLVMRYTLDNMLLELQKKYMETMSLQ